MKDQLEKEDDSTRKAEEQKRQDEEKKRQDEEKKKEEAKKKEEDQKKAAEEEQKVREAVKEASKAADEEYKKKEEANKEVEVKADGSVNWEGGVFESKHTNKETSRRLQRDGLSTERAVVTLRVFEPRRQAAAVEPPHAMRAVPIG